MNEIPLVDWNGNGRIDPEDIALSLAIAGSEAEDQEEDDEYTHGGIAHGLL